MSANRSFGVFIHSRRRAVSLPVLITFLLLFQFNLYVGTAVAMGYMTTLAGLWANGMATAACALQVGTLYPECWGNHPYLGDLDPPVSKSFWAISSGGFFVCGLLYDSRFPSCWGQVNNSVIPSQFLRTRYSNINSGGYHACAVRDNEADNPGLVDCWGNDTFGQASPPMEQMVSVTAGDFFTCGIMASTRHAICWGQDTNSTEMQPPNTSFVSIFAGRYHICGVEQDTFKTLCWGNNTYRQATPVEGYNFTVITGGYSFTCALRADNHEAVCWGETYFDSTLAPVGMPFAAISSGDWFTCGVREDDDEKMTVYCWGTQDNAANNYVPATLKAAMGLCVAECSNGEYEVPDSELGISSQCPGNADAKVCLKCLTGQQCPPNSTSAITHIEPSPGSRSHSKTGIALGVSLAVLAAVVIGLIIMFRHRLYSICMNWRTSAARPAKGDWKVKVSKVTSFTSEELRIATENYAAGMVIGKGGFGDVYKGVLNDGQVVAIKKASRRERATTFDIEIELLAKVHHSCLVNLVGYCEKDICLVFEFMANGSLGDCLFRKRSAELFSWNRRMKIALQAARGLEYLHMYATPPIIHRDVKADNILLDEGWDAHVADFGLSIYGPVGGQSHLSNHAPCGTVGYLDPEYFRSGKLTPKSDVFSFGVVLLELLSGRRAVEPDDPVSSTVAWAEERAELGDLTSILNPELMRAQADEATCRSVLADVIRLALQCVRKTGRDRPTMSEVASFLQTVVESFFFNEPETNQPPSSQSDPSSSATTSSAGNSSVAAVSSYSELGGR
ncbi:hypothetical protein KP509_09G080300 [Ceratopteris richardii]|uniref:non-specific serine/threonine protein kinase n=1 Tax=Ceratopteris richardii TaxID=49495 RepID=A0A8T2U812_CERRI|nr:hypothetical protein KP509_09G080300 [Ceratopteris richardii]